MWFLCLRKAITPREQWFGMLDEHLRWMRQMHEAGSIHVSGPGKDSEGTFYGMYLIRAGARSEAEQLAASDPFTAAGHATFELLEWEIHQIVGIGGFSTAALAALRE